MVGRVSCDTYSSYDKVQYKYNNYTRYREQFVFSLWAQRLLNVNIYQLIVNTLIVFFLTCHIYSGNDGWN